METVFSRFEAICGVARALESRKVNVRDGAELQRTRTLASRCNLPASELEIARDEVPASLPE